MRYHIKSPCGKLFAADPEKQIIEFAGYGKSYRQNFLTFLRFSESAPWDFPVQKKYTFFNIDSDADELIINAENEEHICRMQFHFDGELLKGELFIEFKMNSEKNHIALTIPVKKESLFTLPGVLYNDNPAVADIDTVAHFSAVGNASLIVEENRLPIPGVNAEKNNFFISLLSVPSAGSEWSMGLNRDQSGNDWLMLSDGCLSFNGVKDRIYSAKRDITDLHPEYRNFTAGKKIYKNFAISWGWCDHSGHGFRDLIKSGYQLLAPVALGALSRAEVINLKQTALEERWADSGYLCTMPDNIYRRTPTFTFGWVGQSFRLALCDLRNSLLKKETAGIERMYKCIDFFLQNSPTAVPGLHYNYFDLENLSWHANGTKESPCFSSRSLGETWSDLARIIRCCREHGLPEPEGAMDALENGLQFILDHRLPGGGIPFMWNNHGEPCSPEVSCAGTSVLPAFFEYYRLTGEEKWFRYATEMLDIFYKIGADEFQHPFSHATLDAKCEDKEAAIPFFVASALAWEISGSKKFRTYAEISADWLLTWVYFHDIQFRQGSMCDLNNFRSTGWSSVSVEHHHLDVFFPAWELYKFGKATGSHLYMQMGKNIFTAWSHGISTGKTHWFFQNPGRQAEQFFPTSWFFVKNGQESWSAYAHTLRYRMTLMGYNAENLAEMQQRGGCNPWDPAWIIALVLDAALAFEEETFSAID